MSDNPLPTDNFDDNFKDKTKLKYRITNGDSEDRESWTFDTKEEFFEKLIEVNHLDKYDVVHFRMKQSFFGFPVHIFSHSVVAPNGSERVFFMETTAACHKDGLHEKFLTEY